MAWSSWSGRHDASRVLLGDSMLRTVKATINKNGKVKLAEPVSLRSASRALVTILDDDTAEDDRSNEAALLSESSLARDWLRPEEDKAWEHVADLPDLDKAPRSRNGKKGRR